MAHPVLPVLLRALQTFLLKSQVCVRLTFVGTLTQSTTEKVSALRNEEHTKDDKEEFYLNSQPERNGPILPRQERSDTGADD